MLKNRLNLRNMVAIAICLAVTTMYSGCKSEKSEDPIPVSIDAGKQPTKKVYKIGDEFDPTGLEITVNFEEAKPKTINADNPDLKYDYDFSTGSKCMGDKKVTVMYKGLTVVFYVTVTPSNETSDDGRGHKIEIPFGALSCAIRVVSFTHGNAWTNDPKAMDPDKILGIPDYDRVEDINYVTLGDGGEIVLEFGVYFNIGKGNDIYVFEIGPNVEATKVEVSEDLQNWIFVGNADGSLSGVDMDGKVSESGKFKYIRLTDLYTNPGGKWAGADIDAVAVLYPVFE